MKKLMFVLLAAIMFASMFVAVKQARAATEAMILDPIYNVVNPPMDGSDLTFVWPVNISTATQVSAWEAKLLWDPAVVRFVEIEWGTFMSGAEVSNSLVTSSGQEWVLFGQNFIEQHTVTGDGVLANVKFTFVLPGFTQMWFLEAKVWDDSLVETNLLSGYAGNTVNGQLKSNRPHPVFTWRTDDGINPCPNHTCYDQGRLTASWTVVHFNGTVSYDVSNVGWTGTNWEHLPGYPDIVRYRWEWGDGTPATDGVAGVVDHVFQGYSYLGYTVNLTVWDSEGDWWSSTWRFGGSFPTDTVPMWRDLAIVDIWPSLPPYQNWEEYGDDWGNYWFFDSTDFWLANTGDNYWNYLVDFPSYGYPPGETVMSAWNNYGSEGLYILVTANNFGSVPEKALIRLYAVYVELDIRMAPPPATARLDTSVDLIGSWSRVIPAGAGTGWNCYTIWMPPKNGTYVLFATIEAAQETQIYDGDRSNDYMALTQAVCNIASWDSVGLSLRTNPVFVQYMCDIEGNGKVGPEDFALLSSNYGAKPPKSPGA
jgi:hypothetical protein